MNFPNEPQQMTAVELSMKEIREEQQARERAGNPERLITDLKVFLERFIAYPSADSVVAHAFWILHTHLIDEFHNTPRLAFLSPEPGSGKSRAMEITESLVPRPEYTVNNTVSFIFRAISDEAGKPTLLLDEADAVFSNKRADGNEDLRGLLNSGYRKGAVIGRTSWHGNEAKLERFPSFCAVALAGLNRLPDTLMDRAIVIPMKKRRPDQVIENYRPRKVRGQSEALKERLALYAEGIRSHIADAEPELPDTIGNRDADKWEPLIALADTIGGHWPQTVREVAERLIAESNNRPATLGIRLLGDARKEFRGDDRLSSSELLMRLHALEAAPWGNLKGEPIDARFLARELGKYGIESKTIRFSDKPLKGYFKSDFFDAWARYLPEETTESETASAACLTCKQPLHEAVIADGFTTCPSCAPVTPVTLVTDFSE